ncbi:transposable element Tcb1 transposase [Trichonephila clavipes]|nr:transposable element Tcb1 transposase [Trichonephila clavipes]
MPNDDQYLEVTAKRNGRSTASYLSRQLPSATGTTVSRQPVYRRLGHIGLYARRPVTCVPLTATHCRLRLTWSKEHALWTPQQWSCVMFSDESRKERFNKTLANMLSMYVNTEQKNSDEILPFVIFTYDTAKQKKTGFTPLYLFHGRETETTLDTMLPFGPNHVDDDYTGKIIVRAKVSRQLA